MTRAIAYIMSRFPHLPETFILREMNALARDGWSVFLYPLIVQRESIVHREAEPWISRVRCLPFFSAGVLVANARRFIRHPYSYCALWARVLWENRTSLNLLVRAAALLPKAVYTARLMQQEEIPHIHAHYATHPALFAWLIHRMTGISYSLTVHAHDIFVHKAMLATKLRDAAFVVAISAFNREYLAQFAGPWVREKIHVIHCGIEPDSYAPRADISDRKERFEILNIGSLQPYKGHPYLIRACSLLRDRGVKLRCRIIGGGEDREKLGKAIAEARLEGVVELLGPRTQEEVARILPTAHCYVQPSIITPSGKMEGIPVALMEALACGLPVVATSLSGIPELVRHGETGYLVPPADAAALADALADVYEDPEGALRMAQKGRGLVLAEFDLYRNVDLLARLFETSGCMKKSV